MDIVWDGITRNTALNEDAVAIRSALADAAKAHNWPSVIELLCNSPRLINSSRPDGKSRFAPLHQAAYGGAPVEVVVQLIGMGAWRTLQNARGERPVDVADRMGHVHLLEVLEPVLMRRAPVGVLSKIQDHFHAVIRGRAEQLVQKHSLRLPELEPLLEIAQPQMWFAVPGMYGGFSFRLESAGVEAKLVSESWCRVVGGSGQRHEIVPEGSRLVEEGFA